MRQQIIDLALDEPEAAPREPAVRFTETQYSCISEASVYRVADRPCPLSDNGASCISADLAIWFEGKGMDKARGAPRHHRTQGNMERWHQTLKNRILLENYDLPGALEEAVATHIEH